MSEHFIKNIEIKNFKCFKDFKAEGFGRVNLIGGKNNVGKTAFMEACFLSTAIRVQDLYGMLLSIETHRNAINLLLFTRDRNQDLQNLIIKNINFTIIKTLNKVSITKMEDGTIKIDIEDTISSYSLSDLINLLDIYLEFTKHKNSFNFISQNSNANYTLNTLISELKLEDKYNEFNRYLKEIFAVESIDFINNIPMLKTNGRYSELSGFGQGIKTFIDIISSMLLLPNEIIFIDEVENGIHYTHLDRLWEIILTISKQQNVQVFATTHSKECIESYARVAKKL